MFEAIADRGGKESKSKLTASNKYLESNQCISMCEECQGMDVRTLRTRCWESGKGR